MSKGAAGAASNGSSWVHWATPRHFTELVEQVGPIVLDPCSNLQSSVPAWWRLTGDQALLMSAREPPSSSWVRTRVFTPAGGYGVVEWPWNTPGPSGDGLNTSWVSYLGQSQINLDAPGNGLVFVNPPYNAGAMPRWMAKCAAEATQGATIIGLLASRPSAGWFRTVMESANAVVFWGPGRIQFDNPPPAKCQNCGKTEDEHLNDWCPGAEFLDAWYPKPSTGSSVESLVPFWGPPALRDRFLEVFEQHGYGFELR